MWVHIPYMDPLGYRFNPQAIPICSMLGCLFKWAEPLQGPHDFKEILRRDPSPHFSDHSTMPIGSMYGIFSYIYHKNQPNVGKYILHGSHGMHWNHLFRASATRPQKGAYTKCLHPRKTNECALKKGTIYNRKRIFQLLIFRGHSLVFQGVHLNLHRKGWKNWKALFFGRCKNLVQVLCLVIFRAENDVKLGSRNPLTKRQGWKTLAIDS